MDLKECCSQNYAYPAHSTKFCTKPHELWKEAYISIEERVYFPNCQYGFRKERKMTVAVLTSLLT